jgi:hypothetical protein
VLRATGTTRAVALQHIGDGVRNLKLIRQTVMYEDFSAYASMVTTLVWVLQNELLKLYESPTVFTDALLTVAFVGEACFAVYEANLVRYPELKELSL